MQVVSLCLQAPASLFSPLRQKQFVGVRWRPLARQRTRCRGNYTCALRSVGARWHPLARQRTKNIRNNILFAIRWRSPRLAYIIIIMSGAGCGRGERDGRARRLPSIVGPTHLHMGSHDTATCFANSQPAVNRQPGYRRGDS